MTISALAPRKRKWMLAMTESMLVARRPVIVIGNGLGIIGLVFGAVTVAVITISGVLVLAHVNGNLTFEEQPPSAVAQYREQGNERTSGSFR
jgi:predicted alpha/beta hydrolase family esterase